MILHTFHSNVALHGMSIRFLRVRILFLRVNFVEAVPHDLDVHAVFAPPQNELYSRAQVPFQQTVDISRRHVARVPAIDRQEDIAAVQRCIGVSGRPLHHPIFICQVINLLDRMRRISRKFQPEKSLILGTRRHTGRHL